MKKLILAGIVIIIGCLIFIIIQQNSSRADIDIDLYAKTYPVPFGDWVLVYLSACFENEIHGQFLISVGMQAIEGKTRFNISLLYNPNTEIGKHWYQENFPKIKEGIRGMCADWTAEGYPISLNDFQFDITPY